MAIQMCSQQSILADWAEEYFGYITFSGLWSDNMACAKEENLRRQKQNA